MTKTDKFAVDPMGLKAEFQATTQDIKGGDVIIDPEQRKALESGYRDAAPLDTSGETLQELNDLLSEEDKALLQSLLHNAIEMVVHYDAGELGQVLVTGHDMENNIHVAAQLLRMVKGRTDLNEYTLWELAISAVEHNMGRWLGYDDKLHQVAGARLVEQVTEYLLQDYGEQIRPYQLAFARILRNILEHSGKNGGDPVGDLIRACDRFQQPSPLGPFRELLYDVGRDGIPLFPPINDLYRLSVPLNTPPDERGVRSNWLAWVEMMARNLYPFYDSESNNSNPPVFQEIMQANQIEADRRRALSVAQLMITSNYQEGIRAEDQTPLAQQVFSTELELAGENPHWSKARIPDQIMQNGGRQMAKFKSKLEALEIASPQLFASMAMEDWVTYFLNATNSIVDPAALSKILESVGELTEAQKRAMWEGCCFGFVEYVKELEAEKRSAVESSSSTDPSIRELSSFVTGYLEHKGTNSEFFELKQLFASFLSEEI